MSDRTLCDSTRISKTLARLSDVAFGLWPFIFQETDDYGKLDTDSNLIKAQRFPLIMWVTPPIIEHCIQEYQRVKMLFLWQTQDHRYGKFVNFDAKSGRYLSKRRASIIPDPPAAELAKFLSDNNHFPPLPKCSYKLSQVKLSKERSKESLPSAPSIFQQVKDRFKTLWPDIEVLSDGQIGLLIGTKKRRRNVYGFGFPHAILECLSQITLEYAAEIKEPFLYLKAIAGNPGSAEKYKKEGYRRMKLAETRLGRIFDNIKKEA